MATSKKYFHDHLVLLLLSINVFVAVAAGIFVLVKLGTGHSNSYIVQCRDCSNPDATNKFSTGSIADLLSFVVFAGLVVIAHGALSFRAYHIHRQLAIAILSLGVLLLLLTIIVSNALLVLR
jgi:hypothetical protein